MQLQSILNLETPEKRAKEINQKLFFFTFSKNWVGPAMGNKAFYGDGLNVDTVCLSAFHCVFVWRCRRNLLTIHTFKWAWFWASLLFQLQWYLPVQSHPSHIGRGFVFQPSNDLLTFVFVFASRINGYLNKDDAVFKIVFLRLIYQLRFPILCWSA